MLQLLIDENLNQRILRGLKRRMPGLDAVTAQEVGLSGIEDPQVLGWAAENNRITVTHDVNTIPKYAYERLAAGESMPGIVVIPEELPIGEAIGELLTFIECSEQAEWDGQVVHLPL
jgi:hypothetical protein